MTDVVTAVWQRLPGYSVDRLDRSDLEEFVAPHIRLVIRLLERGRLPRPAEVARARALGESRALQGVPVESVVHSFRVAEQSVLRVLTRNVPLVDPTVFAHTVDLLVGIFNELIAAATAAYRKAQDDVAAHYLQLERDLVADLATGGEARVARAESRSRLLGTNPDLPHLAVALATGSRDDTVRRHVLTVLAARVEGRILHGSVGGVGLLLVPAQDAQRSNVLTLLRRALQTTSGAAGSTCAVGTTAPGLGAVSVSCQQALRVAELAAGLGVSGVVTFEEYLLELAISADRSLTAQLATVVLGGLVGKPVLLDTLRVYLEHDMSQARTAEALVVHPNTVSYRLDRISQLTGMDARQLNGVLRLMVAMRALDLQRGLDR